MVTEMKMIHVPIISFSIDAIGVYYISQHFQIHIHTD